MCTIRSAVQRGALRTIPVDLRRWREWVRPEMDTPYHNYMDWRRPHLYSEHLLWREQPDMGEEIVRSPAHTDADAYFRCDEDCYPSDSEGGEWGQPLAAMHVDWQYEMEDDDMQH